MTFATSLYQWREFSLLTLAGSVVLAVGMCILIIRRYSRGYGLDMLFPKDGLFEPRKPAAPDPVASFGLQPATLYN